MKRKISRRDLLKMAGGVGLGVGLSGWAKRSRAQQAPAFVDMALTPSGDGAWLLDAEGRIVSLGAAPVLGTPPDPFRPICVALGRTPTGLGLYVLTRRGELLTSGDARTFDTSATRNHPTRFVDMEVTQSGDGAWVLDSRGMVFSLGAAPVLTPPPDPFHETKVALVGTPTDQGLYILGRRGNVTTLGDAQAFYNAAAACGTPFADMAGTPSGDGSFLMDVEGHTFSQGAAPNLGAPPDPIKTRYAAVAVTPSGQGIYLLAESGVLKTAGDARTFEPTR
jgi:hypothetical protein